MGGISSFTSVVKGNTAEKEPPRTVGAESWRKTAKGTVFTIYNKENFNF